MPPNARFGAKYCSPACRAMAYRERHKTMRAAQHLEPPIATETSAAKRTETVTDEQTRSRRERRKERATKSDGQTSAKTEPRKARIAFADQLRKQQPEGAAGYRLVLPARSPAETPKIVPGPDAQGGIRYWRLDPFEIPDDIRLQDGLSYRVVWVSATGQPLSATTPYVPSLYFFLGPPDSEQDERNAAYEAIFRDVHDPALRQRIEAEVARSRLALQREREREEILARRTERDARYFEMEARGMEDFRRWQREDQAEQERREEKQKAEREKAAAAQEARNEREMWTAFKVMGGISLAAAIGWGPFIKWLESPKDDEAAKQSQQDGQKLAAQSSRTVDALISDQSTALPSDARSIASEKPQSSPALTAATEPHTAPSQPVAPQAAEKNRPIGTTQAAEVAQQAETKDDGSAYIRSLSAETTKELCAVALHTDLMFHLFALAKNQHPEWNSVTVPNLCAEFLNKDDMSLIKTIAANPNFVRAVAQLADLFRKAKESGPEAMFALPAPLPSLTEQDRQAIKQCLATNEQKEYLAYLMKRRIARLSGKPMPPPQPLRLSAAEQKAIRYLMRDDRAMFYVVKAVPHENPSPQS